MNEREGICRLLAWASPTGGWPGASGKGGESPGFAKTVPYTWLALSHPSFSQCLFNLDYCFLSGFLWVVLHDISSLPFNKADIHAILFIKRLQCAGHYACLQGHRRGERTTLSGSRGSQVTQSLNLLEWCLPGVGSEPELEGGGALGGSEEGLLGPQGAGHDVARGILIGSAAEGVPPSGSALLERSRQITLPQQSAAPEAEAGGVRGASAG